MRQGALLLWFWLGLCSCTIGTRTVHLVDVRASAKEESGPAAAVWISVREGRPSTELDNVGRVRTRGISTAQVVTARSPLDWLRDSWALQLQAAGIDASPVPDRSRIELRIHLRRCHASGYWLPQAEVTASLEVRPANRATFQQTFTGSGRALLPRPGGSGGFAAALHRALKDLLRQAAPGVVAEVRTLASPAG